MGLAPRAAPLHPPAPPRCEEGLPLKTDRPSSISETPLAHASRGTRGARSLEFQLSHTPVTPRDNLCTNERERRSVTSPAGPVPKGWARGASELFPLLPVSCGCLLIKKGEPGDARGPRGAPAPSAPLPRAWAAKAHRFHEAPRRSPPNPLPGRGLRKPTVSPKTPKKSSSLGSPPTSKVASPSASTSTDQGQRRIPRQGPTTQRPSPGSKMAPWWWHRRRTPS